MSQISTGHLTKEKIERLKTFLKTDSIEQCCEKFNVRSPAFREGISNTVRSLHGFYVKGIEHYIGNFSSTRDISFNKAIILTWIKRCDKRDKPNAFPECEAIEANEEEIIRGIIDAYPPKNQNQSYEENKHRIQGAMWLFKHYRVTGKIK